MVYKVAIVGHSQVPLHFPDIPDVEVRIFRKSGAKLSDFHNYREFQQVFTWPHQHTIIFMGGNDIGVGPNRWSPQRIATFLIRICWNFKDFGNTVSLVLIEPRTYFSDYVHNLYHKQAEKINRRLKRYSQHSEAPYHTINFNAVPFQQGHTIDGTHFRPITVQHIISKLQNAILWQKQKFDLRIQH